MQTLPDREFVSNAFTMAPPSVQRPTGPYADANDRIRHLDEMQRLAQETDCPLHVITPIYESTLVRLRADATIHDYLPILVAKGVRNALKDATLPH